jgi:hypothetical protein
VLPGQLLLHPQSPTPASFLNHVPEVLSTVSIKQLLCGSTNLQEAVHCSSTTLLKRLLCCEYPKVGVTAFSLFLRIASGGQPYSVIGVVDTIQSIKPQVQTVALGAVYSYSSLILASGTPGKRYSMKNTRIMMTQPMGE